MTEPLVDVSLPQAASASRVRVPVWSAAGSSGPQAGETVPPQGSVSGVDRLVDAPWTRCQAVFSGSSSRSVWAICSGLYRRSSHPWTLSCKIGSLASLRSFGRTSRRRAMWWALNGRYRPASSRLRRTSRLTVDAGWRPSSRPMARRRTPARTRSAIRTRASSDKNLADRHVVLVVAMGG